MRQKYKGEDVRARLHGTIIRYNNHPYVCNVDSTGMIGLHDLSNNNLVANVNADDENLDISSISVGYVNLMDPGFKFAIYLKREPLRRFKQGIEIDFLTQKTLFDGLTSIPKQKLMSRGLVDAIVGKFPSFKMAIEMITKGGWHSVALSRDLALKREDDTLKVYIKDSEVGWMKLGSNKITVPRNEYSYFYVSILEDIKDWEVVEGIR